MTTDLEIVALFAALALLRYRTLEWQRGRFWHDVALCTLWCVFAVCVRTTVLAAASYFIVAAHAARTLTVPSERSWPLAVILMLSLLALDATRFGSWPWIATIVACALALPSLRKLLLQRQPRRAV